MSRYSITLSKAEEKLVRQVQALSGLSGIHETMMRSVLVYRQAVIQALLQQQQAAGDNHDSGGGPSVGGEDSTASEVSDSDLRHCERDTCNDIGNGIPACTGGGHTDGKAEEGTG